MRYLSSIALILCLAALPAMAESNERGGVSHDATPRGSPRYAATSRVLGIGPRAIADGEIVCVVDFVYAGHKPEDLFWEEPCAKVTAIMVKRAELERLGYWIKLDEFQRKFVDTMPGGLVLLVSGEFSAAIYPYGDAGVSEEIYVAD